MLTDDQIGRAAAVVRAHVAADTMGRWTTWNDDDGRILVGGNDGMRPARPLTVSLWPSSADGGARVPASCEISGSPCGDGLALVARLCAAMDDLLANARRRMMAAPIFGPRWVATEEPAVLEQAFVVIDGVAFVVDVCPGAPAEEGAYTVFLTEQEEIKPGRYQPLTDERALVVERDVPGSWGSRVEALVGGLTAAIGEVWGRRSPEDGDTDKEPT